MCRLFSGPRQGEYKISMGKEEKQAMKTVCLNCNIVTGDGMDSSDRILANHRRFFFCGQEYKFPLSCNGYSIYKWVRSHFSSCVTNMNVMWEDRIETDTLYIYRFIL